MTAVMIGVIVCIVFFFASTLMGFTLDKLRTEESKLEDSQKGFIRIYHWGRDLVVTIMLIILLGLCFL